MKKTKKTPFFIKLKNAIFKFDSYQAFAGEKISSSIKYFLKITLLFSLIAMTINVVRTSQSANKVIEIFRNEFPEFAFQDNSLTINGENKEFEKNDEEGLFSIILNSEKEELNEVSNTTARTYIALLKDKLVIKDSKSKELSIAYENIGKQYDISKLNKETIINYIENNLLAQMSFKTIIVLFISFYISYTASIILNILILSVIGCIISSLINVRFRYKTIFNLSIYSITLSVVLDILYTIVNGLTGFIINYFEIAYNAISYIYLITAMLIIKSDLIKQQMELNKIIEVQKKVNKEADEEQQEEKENKKEDKEKTKLDNEETEENLDENNSCKQE